VPLCVIVQFNRQVYNDFRWDKTIFVTNHKGDAFELCILVIESEKKKAPGSNRRPDVWSPPNEFGGLPGKTNE